MIPTFLGNDLSALWLRLILFTFDPSDNLIQPFGKFASPDFDRSKIPVSRDSYAILAIFPGSPISAVSIGFLSNKKFKN